jgi:hypothetical protein
LFSNTFRSFFLYISGSNLRTAHVHPVLTIIAYIFFFRMDNNHNIKIFSFVWFWVWSVQMCWDWRDMRDVVCAHRFLSCLYIEWHILELRL